ncbi:hypothetical protein PI124_g16349 [Phytophthora idaei]|nr:hypothetical protein PI126_g15474 [Phytophthora idaei]KAG3238691.1 hypothetical protein PI124_g16349 [Phytophthora idaei]
MPPLLPSQNDCRHKAARVRHAAASPGPHASPKPALPPLTSYRRSPLDPPRVRALPVLVDWFYPEIRGREQAQTALLRVRMPPGLPRAAKRTTLL